MSHTLCEILMAYLSDTQKQGEHRFIVSPNETYWTLEALWQYIIDYPWLLGLIMGVILTRIYQQIESRK
jgi:hypothetical protein